MSELFSVFQFFPDGSHEEVRQAVEAEEAVIAAIHYATSVGARLGTTVRVIITDADDSVAFDWRRSEGVIFPPGCSGWLMNGVRPGAPS